MKNSSAIIRQQYEKDILSLQTSLSMMVESSQQILKMFIGNEASYKIVTNGSTSASTGETTLQSHIEIKLGENVVNVVREEGSGRISYIPSKKFQFNSKNSASIVMLGKLYRSLEIDSILHTKFEELFSEIEKADSFINKRSKHIDKLHYFDMANAICHEMFEGVDIQDLKTRHIKCGKIILNGIIRKIDAEPSSSSREAKQNLVKRVKELVEARNKCLEYYPLENATAVATN